MPTIEPNSTASSGKRRFATTHWSLVIAAADARRPDARQALAELCETYWYPLYAYVRRRVGNTAEAEDITQSFFSQLLEKDTIAKARPDRGRFRAFLLTALKNFLANEWHKARAQKRGGTAAKLSLDFTAGESRYRFEPAHELTPDKLYERRWVLTLLDRVLDSLREELAARGKARHFEQFKATLLGEATAADYDEAARALEITPAAAKQAAYRMRKRYSQLLREEVARTVDGEEEVDDEIARLLEILGE